MSLNRHLPALASILLSSLTWAAPATAGPRWYAAGEVSSVVPDRELFRGTDVSLGAGVGLVLSEAARVELGYQATRLVPGDLPGLLEQNSAQIVGIYDYLRGQRWQVYAGLALGASRARYLGETATLPFATGSTGLSWALAPSGRVRLDAEVRTRYTYDEDEMLGRSGIRDSQFVLRLRWHFGGTTPGSADAPEPLLPGSPSTRPLERAAPADRDGDGVSDDRDACPNTIPSVAVDTDGCMTRR